MTSLLKPKLTLDWTYRGETKRFESTEGTFIIGRSIKACALCLPDCDVLSREHIKIEIDRDKVWIRDLGSSNGTYYRNARLLPHMACLFRSGEVFYLGAPDKGLRIIMVLTLPKQEIKKEEEKAEVELPPEPTEAITPEKSKIIIQEITRSTAHEDEFLVKMQMIENEIDVLNHKKQTINQEISQLEAGQKKYLLLEAEFKSNLSGLARVQAELEQKQLSLTTLQSELTQLQLAIDQARDARAETETEQALVTVRLDKSQLNLNQLLEEIKKYDAALAERANSLQTYDQQVETSKNKNAEFLNLISIHDQRMREIETKIRELSTEYQSLIEKKRSCEEKISFLNTEINNLEIKKSSNELQFQQQYKQEQSDIASITERKKEIQISYDKAQIELDHVQKRVKFELDNLDAECKLKKAIVVREVEEVLTQKAVVSRELDAIRHSIVEAQGSLAAVQQSIQIEQLGFQQILKNAESLQTQNEESQRSLEALNHRRAEVDKVIASILLNSEESARKTRGEADSYVLSQKADLQVLRNATDKEISDQREAFDRELYEKKKKNNIELEEFQTGLNIKRSEMQLSYEVFQKELEIRKSEAIRLNDAEVSHLRMTKDKFKKQHEEEFETLKEEVFQFEKGLLAKKLALVQESEELKKRLTQEHEQIISSLKEEASQAKTSQAEELRVWSANEEARVKAAAVKNAKVFAHFVSMKTIAQYPSVESITTNSLIHSLEKNIFDAINDHVEDEGSFDPKVTARIRKFWIRTAIGAVVLVAFLVGITYGPKLMSNQIETMKVASQEEDTRYINEIRIQREQMLALHLEVREAFQNTFVDNILYNPGYLAMKLDPEIQKQWTIELSKFFLNELLLDDRKLVAFIPLENSLISNLNDMYKILNSQNFDVNLAKMKQTEDEKVAEIRALVVNPENWVKIRSKEAAFYAEHGKVGHQPASAK